LDLDWSLRRGGPINLAPPREAVKESSQVVDGSFVPLRSQAGQTASKDSPRVGNPPFPGARRPAVRFDLKPDSSAISKKDNDNQVHYKLVLEFNETHVEWPPSRVI
jgi:hypothetical protein